MDERETEGCVNMIICNFSSALSDIPARRRVDRMFVLRTLKANPRFSCFEASEHQTLSVSLVWLKDAGCIEYPQPQPQYPWNSVNITARGEEFLAKEDDAIAKAEVEK